ncbi:hypothetical protein [Cellulomonas sp. SG140]|uniref:hypothetical protein n=1 Tax=Cellulomonas sp. SG140 TaxID=2976536 RepID=UPI0021E6DCB1|nr:hypothetical protein [Cellulomonas sp. SG140]
MSRTKRAGLALAVAAAAALGLAGCGSAGDGSTPAQHVEGLEGADVAPVVVELAGGHSVTCVVYDGYKSGGISCDWSKQG